MSSSREVSKTPTDSGGKSKKKRKKVVKGKFGNYHSLGRVMGMMARMMAVTLHPPTRSNSTDNNKSDEEDEVKKRKVNPKLWLPAPKVLTKNTLFEGGSGT